MTSWTPAKTRLFVVGTLAWKNSNELAAFDKAGRKDNEIVKFFKKAGVPKNNIQYFCDEKATNDAVLSAFPDFVSSTKADETLIFYYCGHGYSDDDGYYFATYDCNEVDKMSIEFIVDTVNSNFTGKHVIMMADCCHSGYMVKRAEEKAKEGSTVDWAVFASVHYKKSSTGNWTFSSAVLNALNGEAFLELDNDGKITLPELEKHIQEDMALVEQQHGAVFVSPSMKNFVLTATVKPRAHKRVGQIVNIDYCGDNYLARVEKFEGGQFGVRYFSYLNNEEGWVGESELMPVKPVTFKNGSHMEAYSENDEGWFACSIVRSLYGLHLIKYDDWDESYNEWMHADHLRPVLND